MVAYIWVAAVVAGAPSDYLGGTFCATGGDIADSGVMRLKNGDPVCWEAATPGTDKCVSVNGNDRLTVPPFTKNQHRSIGHAMRGGTAPAEITIGNARCVQFNQAQTAETIHLDWIITADWVGDSDMELHFRVFPESGDPLADGEVIEFDVTYNVLAVGDAYDKASTTISPSYTQSGAGTEKALLCLDAVIDYDDATNPLAVNSQVYVSVDLDETATTYSGNPILCQLHTKYTANAIESKAD